MLAIFFLNAHNLPIFQLILMILVSKFMVHRALSDKSYLSLGLLSPLMYPFLQGKVGIKCLFYEYIFNISTVNRWANLIFL